MADDSALPRLHEDDRRWLLEGLREDLRAIFEATAQGPAASAPGRPPANFDGLDSQQFSRFKRDILHDVGDAVRQATTTFLPEDEINERIASVNSAIDRRFDAFKAGFLEDVRKIVAEENAKLKAEFFEIFEDIDMPLQREGGKRKKTAERLSGLFAMHDSSKEFKSEFWKALRASAIGGIVTAITGAFVYMFTRGGPAH